MCFPSKLLPLCTTYPQMNHCTSFNSYQSTTCPTYIYHLFTQLLLHHNTNTTNSIIFFRPSQHIHPSLNPDNPIFTTANPTNHTHESSSFSVLHKHLLPFHSDNLNSVSNPHPKASFRPSVILLAMIVRSRMQGCTFHFMMGRCPPGTHNNRLP